MRFSPPTNPLLVELAKLSLRLQGVLVRTGVSVRRQCSRSISWGMASPSVYLHVDGGDAMIRISNHPRRHAFNKGLDLVATRLDQIPALEALALAWIEEHYGKAQVQAA